MKIRITEPPKHKGLREFLCQYCGSEILICETKAGATIVLDERPGPFRLEDDGTGQVRAVHRHAVDGYSFHFENEGSCAGSEVE
jgi:hypothetical protein